MCSWTSKKRTSPSQGAHVSVYVSRFICGRRVVFYRCYNYYYYDMVNGKVDTHLSRVPSTVLAIYHDIDILNSHWCPGRALGTHIRGFNKLSCRPETTCAQRTVFTVSLYTVTMVFLKITFQFPRNVIILYTYLCTYYISMYVFNSLLKSPVR